MALNEVLVQFHYPLKLRDGAIVTPLAHEWPGRDDCRGAGRGFKFLSSLRMTVSFLTWDGLKHLAMPAVNLALFKLSLLVRLTRGGTREALLQDYVKFARAKGLPARRVIGVHVLKNILIPIVTVIGLELGSVIAYAVVTESIFASETTGPSHAKSAASLARKLKNLSARCSRSPS